jgi:hypothetical protein
MAEQNQLWDSPVNWFAKSSGTTSDKSKFIPLQKKVCRTCHFQAGKDVLTLYYHFNPESNLLTGKGLVIGGSHQVSRLNEELFFGDLSAVLMQNMPMWGHWIRTPELAIALLDEWEKKIESLAQSTILENVTSISGVPTWTQVLIKRILKLQAGMQQKKYGRILNLYAWRCIVTPYKENFKNYWVTVFITWKCIMPVKGFLQRRMILNQEGMLLFLSHGIFYEFMPVEEYGKQNPQTSV